MEINSLNSQQSESKETIFERVEFLCDKSLFKGKVYRPQNLEDCKGSVIFTHGLGYCDRQYKINGEYFARNNYLMLTYNLRGHAGTEGKWTLNNSVEDLIEGINFLTQRYNFANKERICVIGHSTGALITLLASLKDKRIKFGSVVTTVTSLTESYLHWFESGFNNEVKEFFKAKGVIPPIIDNFLDDKTMLDKYRGGELTNNQLDLPHRYGLLKSENFNEFFHEIAFSPNIIDRASEINIPILFFRGEYDEVMDVKKTNELYEKLRKRIPSKLYITDSHNHFHNDRWDMIQTETLKFFDKYCSFKSKEVTVAVKDILIIDDETLVTRTLGNLLKKETSLNIVIANNGYDALEEIKKIKDTKNKGFDLIICDIRMPSLDGIETIKRAKNLISDINERESPVIFMTGYDGEKTQEEAKSLGYVDYLYKPFDTEDFLSSVKKYLR